MGQSEALLKERLYWKKGLMETNSKIWLKFQNLVQILKFGWNSGIVKLCQNCEGMPKLWNLVKNLKFRSKVWKFCQNSENSWLGW